MTRCDEVRPLLPRVAEGEADPEEALRVAIHLRECTACRIVLAKDRRLVRILEDWAGDPVAVPDDFARCVMERLPAGRPPGARRRRSTLRRGFRIVGGAGVVAFALGLASKLHAPAVAGPVWSWTSAIETGATRGLPAVFAWIVKTLAAAIASTGSAVRLDLPGLLPGWPGTDVAIAASTLAVILTFTAAAIAARVVSAARGN